MPHAICEKCSRVFYWQNCRGSTIKDAKCGCGGSLAAASWVDGKYVKREGFGTKGPVIECTLCGKRRKRDGTNVRRPGPGFRLTEYDKARYKIEELPPDAVVCWHHLEKVQAVAR